MSSTNVKTLPADQKPKGNTNYAAEPGRVVMSLAGRDAGKYFVIYGVDGVYCTIVDGRYHKLALPKKKKLKHLLLTDAVAITLATKWAEKKKVFDSEVAGRIKEFVQAKTNKDSDKQTKNENK